MGLWGSGEPDEAAVREAMRRIKRDRDREKAEAVGAFLRSATGGLGCLWLLLHAATFCVLMTLVGGAVAQWLRLGPVGGLACGLVPAVVWWRSGLRARHPVLAVPAGFFGAVLLAWALLRVSGG